MLTTSNHLLITLLTFLKQNKGFILAIAISSLFVIYTGCTGNGQSTNHKPGNDSIPESDTVADLPFMNYIESHSTAKYKTVSDIPLPNGFERIELADNSFGAYLRGLELDTADFVVHLFNGQRKYYQDGNFAIIVMDVGKRDLQQCADAVMRLRGEYLFEQKRYNEIHFNFLSDGQPRYYTEYAGSDRTHGKFRRYMDYIFSYANTSSLADELKKVDIKDIQPGDVFIQKGSPYGHAVTVMDVAINNSTGEKIFMVSQSYMPAQEIHILKNLEDFARNPWYTAETEKWVYTPEWTFTVDDLKRFSE